MKLFRFIALVVVMVLATFAYLAAPASADGYCCVPSPCKETFDGRIVCVHAGKLVDVTDMIG